jgi:hypothetical protein
MKNGYLLKRLILPSAHFQPPLVDRCQSYVDDVDFLLRLFTVLGDCLSAPENKNGPHAKRALDRTKLTPNAIEIPSL